MAEKERFELSRRFGRLRYCQSRALDQTRRLLHFQLADCSAAYQCRAVEPYIASAEITISQNRLRVNHFFPISLYFLQRPGGA